MSEIIAYEENSGEILLLRKLEREYPKTSLYFKAATFAGIAATGAGVLVDSSIMKAICYTLAVTAGLNSLNGLYILLALKSDMAKAVQRPFTTYKIS